MGYDCDFNNAFDTSQKGYMCNVQQQKKRIGS